MVIIGSENFVGGFRALGIATFVVTNDIEGSSLLKKLRTSEYNIICISEDLAEKIKDEIKEITESTRKSILALPCLGEKGGFARKTLRILAERAAGTDIFE